MSVDFNKFPALVDKIEVTMQSVDDALGEVEYLDKDSDGSNNIYPNGWPVRARFNFANPFDSSAPAINGLVVDTYGGIPSDIRGAIRFDDPRVTRASRYILGVNGQLDGVLYSPFLSDEQFCDQSFSAPDVKLAVAGALGYVRGLNLLDKEN